MKSAVATRFGCSRPLTDLEQLTPMFLALILQYLNKLVERKIRDLASPQAFHARKVQGFNGDCVKPLTKFRGKLPLKVFALVGDFPIQACDLSHTPPPAVRPFLLPTQCLVERPKFAQVRFQRLWVLFLLTRAQRQIGVFHTEICPNALTCCRQRFRFYKIGDDVQPIITTSVTFDYDTTDMPIKLTVFMESVSHFVMSPLTFIPFSEIEGEAIVFQRPPRLLKHKRFKFMTGLPLRLTTQFLKESHIGSVNPPQFLLNRLTRQCFPMWVCRPLQIGQVGRHRMIVRIGEPLPIPCVLPPVETVMHLPYIVKQVSNTDTLRLIAKLIFIGFHGLSHITPLTPDKWVGPTRNLAVTLVMSVQCDRIKYTPFCGQCQIFFRQQTQRPPTSRKLKHGVLAGRVIKIS